MKVSISFTSVALLILISVCSESEKDLPVASFIFSPESVEVGDTVYFESTVNMPIPTTGILETAPVPLKRIPVTSIQQKENLRSFW